MISTITDAEWDELVSLKLAITENPASVVPEKMELFSELFVKSLHGKGNYTNYTEPTNY
jgi:hypothetical protein